jgi:hypothetical protein
MALLNALGGNDPDGNIQGIRNRNQALKDIGAGALKNSPSNPAPKKTPVSSPADKVNPKAQYGDKAGEKRIDVKDMVKPLGSYKKGGKVKKTGLYKLHKKERVLNPKQTAKVEKSGGLRAILGGSK